MIEIIKTLDDVNIWVAAMCVVGTVVCVGFIVVGFVIIIETIFGSSDCDIDY